MKDQEIRWGIIGVGNVCEVKSGPALQFTEGSRLVAVMRRNGEKAQDYARRHGVPRWYDNAHQLIADPEVNAVYIATPPDTHEYYTHLAAAAGKPVYVEKPMARTHIECLSMIRACEKAGVPLFVAYYRRALPNFQKVKSLIENGAIGKVRAIDLKLIKPLKPDLERAGGQGGNWRVQPEIAGGGYFYDLASHQLDFLDYVFGPITQARGFAGNQGGLYPAEDVVTGIFRFESGILGQGLWCFTGSDDSELDLTTIYGSKGSITFSYFSDHKVTLYQDGAAPEVMSFDMPKHIQQPLIQQVVDELLGKGKSPSTGISGARTNRVLADICRSVQPS